MPKLSHLRCFAAVAEAHSITAAAKRLHRSPSAVSMTLSGLEAELGRNLFEADGKSRLTPFGAYVFSIASEQLRRFQRAIENIEAYASNGFGRIDMAAVPSFASHYLPQILSNFSSLYPQIILSVRDDNSTRINQLISQREIDVGIASPIQDSQRNVDYQPMLSDPIGVICSRNHMLAKLGRPLRWGDLQEQAFIANGTCRHIEDEDFQEIVENAEIDVQNTTSILAMVAANIGITTLPRLAVPELRDDVVFLTTEYESLQRSIGILTPNDRSLSPASEAFVETVLSIMKLRI